MFDGTILIAEALDFLYVFRIYDVYDEFATLCQPFPEKGIPKLTRSQPQPSFRPDSVRHLERAMYFSKVYHRHRYYPGSIC